MTWNMCGQQEVPVQLMNQLWEELMVGECWGSRKHRAQKGAVKVRVLWLL